MLISIQSQSAMNQTSISLDADGVIPLADAAGVVIAYAEIKNNKVKLIAQSGFSILENNTSITAKSIPHLTQSIQTFANEESSWTVFTRPATKGDKTFRIVGFSKPLEISVGRDKTNHIVYDSPFVTSRHALLLYKEGRFFITDCKSVNGVFINGRKIEPKESFELNYGDVISIVGLSITVGRNFISINNPENLLSVQTLLGSVTYKNREAKQIKRVRTEPFKAFSPSLRFVEYITAKEFIIETPPPKIVEEQTTLLTRIIPSLCMGIASLISACFFAFFSFGSNGSVLRSIPMMVMSATLVVSSVIWPFASQKINQRQIQNKEIKRQNIYSQYLSNIRSCVKKEIDHQKKTLINLSFTPYDCLETSIRRPSLLMGIQPSHKDFLWARVGTGTVEAKIKLSFSCSEIDWQEDSLIRAAYAFANEKHYISNGQVFCKLEKLACFGIVGEREEVRKVLNNIIVQFVSLRRSDDVKLIVMNIREDESLSYLKRCPHIYDDNNGIRYWTSSYEDVRALDLQLHKSISNEYSVRPEQAASKPHYIIICTSAEAHNASSFIQSCYGERIKENISVICCCTDSSELPSACQSFIEIKDTEQAVFNSIEKGSLSSLELHLDSTLSSDEMMNVSDRIGRFADTSRKKETRMPSMLPIMDLLNVSTINQLNIARRWKKQNTSSSLATELGRDGEGNTLYLDLHEDAHGPHALIAGTTGSGKSELIASFILSLAINYSPEDISVVLIDYKGGGIARTFDNDSFRLPHISGTITNIDGSDIQRGLLAIKSELRRRQKMFADARIVSCGETVNINVYTQLLKEGKVSEACPHIVLIVDEFAELKQQEPEFMEELISVSRIGRSLGIHLILATQKPSGVVNDQIWSNSRCKIALKVADNTDSMEIIKTTDAAQITNPGRFYMLIGNNELMLSGQSAYAGFPLCSSADINQYGQQASYISNTGRPLLTIRNSDQKEGKAGISQLVAIAQHVADTAKALKVEARKLWLDPLPSHISLSNIKEVKENAEWSTNGIKAIYGLADIPDAQLQIPALFNLSQGNALIVGPTNQGSEMIVAASIYSLVSNYSTQDIHLYVIDSSQGSLLCFQDMPHVGAVIPLHDISRVKRAFKVIENRYEEEQVSSTDSCTQDEDCLTPLTILIINGLSSLQELIPEAEEWLDKMLRITTYARLRCIFSIESITALRFKWKSSFQHLVACGLSDASSYTSFFDVQCKEPIPKGYGRGLVKIRNAVYEFQAAHCHTQGEDLLQNIQALAAKAHSRCNNTTYAPPVPALPQYITSEYLYSRAANREGLALGVYDESLEPLMTSALESPLFRILFHKKSTGKEFLTHLLTSSSETKQSEIYVFDIGELLDEAPIDKKFSTQHIQIALAKLSDLQHNPSRLYKLLFITGIAKLLEGSNTDEATFVRQFLSALSSNNRTYVILVDQISDATYTYEDWFKKHLTNRDGLWIGPGLETLNAIPLTYNARLLEDSFMSSSKGYFVQGGVPHLVHLVSQNKAA